MTKTQERVIHVLRNMITIAREDDDNAYMFIDGLEEMLNDLHFEDGFGTEGQNDPRGDFRDDNWSMNRVQGIDPGIRFIDPNQ